MERIKLTQGKYALVDDEDFEWLNQWKWWTHKTEWGCYALRTKMKKGKIFIFHMHREILKKQNFELRDLMVDHINGDGLDNRQKNLRIATNSQNQANRRKVVSLSGYKGVNLYRNGKWRATTKINKKQIHLGYYENKQEAAKRYNEFMFKHFGEFAYLNKI